MQQQVLDEFKAQVFLHKCRMILAKATQYYKDLEADSVNIPDFLRDDTPEKKAEAELDRILDIDDDRATFNRCYEKAWEELQYVQCEQIGR